VRRRVLRRRVLRCRGLRRGLLPLAATLLLGACAVDIDVDPKGEGKYTLTVDSDYNTRLQGPEQLLAKRAEALCPDGYDRLKRKSIHKRHGVTEQISWDIQCS
jgi:hypothetical protein